jgi:hypothetical protein
VRVSGSVSRKDQRVSRNNERVLRKEVLMKEEHLGRQVEAAEVRRDILPLGNLTL